MDYATYRSLVSDESWFKGSLGANLRHSMSSIKCALLPIVFAVDAGLGRSFEDAPDFSESAQITSSRDPFPGSFDRLRLHCRDGSQSFGKIISITVRDEPARACAWFDKNGFKDKDREETDPMPGP